LDFGFMVMLTTPAPLQNFVTDRLVYAR
jgi:hypothetical protein